MGKSADVYYSYTSTVLEYYQLLNIYFNLRQLYSLSDVWVIIAKLYMITFEIDIDNIFVYYKKGWNIEYMSLCHYLWSIYELCFLGL